MRPRPMYTPPKPAKKPLLSILQGLPMSLESHRFSLDLLGNLYISLPAERCVGVIKAGSKAFKVIAGHDGETKSRTGPLEKTLFATPRGIEALDFEWLGRIWVCDEAANRVLVIDPSKNESRLAAGCGRIGTRKDGDAKVCELDSPKYIYRLISRPVLLIGQRREDSFRLLNIETNMVTTLKPSGPLPGPLEKTIPHFLYGAEQLVLHSPSTRSKPYVIDIAEEKVLDTCESAKFPSKLPVLPVVSAPFLPAWQYTSAGTGASHTSGRLGSPGGGKVARYDTIVFSTDPRPEISLDTVYKALAYVPHTETLYFLTTDGKLCPTPLTGQPPPCHFISKPELPSPDLSILIDSPLLPSDVLVENDASGANWKLHQAMVLSYINSDPLHRFDKVDKLEKLKSVIKKSTLPHQSIEAFLRFLYLSPLVLTDDIAQSCRLASHIALLYRELGIMNGSLIREFEFKIARKLEPEDLCTAIFEIWNDTHVQWTTKDPLIHVLAWHVRQRAMAEFKKTSFLPDCTRDAELVLFLRQEIPRNFLFQSPKRSILAFDVPLGRHHPLVQVSPGLKPECPTDIVFLCASPKEGYYKKVSASLLPLVPQWPWIRRMLEFGCSENNDRMIFVPDWMTCNILLAILEPMYGPLLPTLSHEEAFSIIERAAEIDLVNIDGKPQAPFESLLKYCNDVCFPPMNNDTIIDLIIKYHRLGNLAKVDELLDSLWTLNASHPVKNLLTLPMELIQALKAKQDVEMARQAATALPHSVVM